MKLALQRTECGNGRTCPNINRTDRDTYVVQGYLPADLVGSTSPATTVELPLALVPELRGQPHRHGVTFTSNDSVLISGERVCDPEALRELQTPDGEAAVEIPLDVLAELTKA